MRGLDVVSPLPPARSGISDYTLDLLPALAALTEVRLGRSQAEIADGVAELYSIVEPENVGSDGRVPLYQMGNNRHHRGVYDLAMAVPGVLTLHDTVLHHFHLEQTLAGGDHEAYLDAVGRDHGWLGLAAGRALVWGVEAPMTRFELPVRRDLLRRQRGVLVHSEWAARSLREEDPTLRVATVPMGMPLPAEPAADVGAAWRREHRLPAAAPLLGSFGFQTPIKRTDRVIRALTRPELESVHLVVAGEAAPSYDLAAVAAESGVEDRVHLLGYLPFDAWQAAILACDVALNLRYPTAGETSASLLRILALGRPVVVSELAQFAELPDEVAAKVALGPEEEDELARVVGALVASPERMRAMGRAARRYVERRHQVSAAAAAVVEACREWAEMEPLGPSPVEVAAPSSLTVAPRAAIRLIGDEASWPSGTRRRVEVELRNEGRCRWLAGRRGPGGLAMTVEVSDGRGRVVESPPWSGLPRDVAPGESIVVETRVRRPVDGGSLRIGLVRQGGGPLDSTPTFERSFD